MSVPKIIHYCWFGGNPKPKLAEKCIKSWKKFCPDYKIIEWNEENFDVSAAPEYVRQAYGVKRWAFVTDYVRLKALTEMGGIYMDTDVELVKPLTPFLAHDAFAGFESDASVQTGLLACCPGFPLFQEFLQHYDSASFMRSTPRKCSARWILTRSSSTERKKPPPFTGLPAAGRRRRSEESWKRSGRVCTTKRCPPPGMRSLQNCWERRPITS